MLLAAALVTTATVTASAQTAPVSGDKPTIILVHGAFAESSSWNPVISKLLQDGYKVIAVAIPLRGVKSDAAYLSSLMGSVPGPIVLVGHSYGGEVISGASDPSGKVRALVYVSGVAPEIGESATMIVGRFPGSTLGPTLAPPVPLPGGGNDLYILQEKFHAQFAADLSASDAAKMAVTQRPITEAAFNELAVTAAWKTVPSWFIYGSLDKNIPPAAHSFMAQRAHAKETIEIQGSSHVVMLSHPNDVVGLIERAARAR
ncbi:MAG TPA: alpha/beta hydrolase [Candidatus Elarobacter sp.]|nr:alpha/beta hydrolase [Candidatus Elarobacter sp.]HEV2737012.1 alpha/beta hydrolase [Candidatus Elarobacter sp.]